ncbi:MAG TPA: hypothetical protein VG074_15045 [Acidimicrobiales bacterium]|nr:hypothetical protein [Acidimicrobiales bacterium]
MNRTIGGIPLIYWIGALGVGILGFAWFRKKSTGTATTGAAAKTPAFSQQQEVEDFQVFSALTSAQQGADLNFLTEVAGLFSGGSSTGATGGAATGGGGGGGSSSPIPSPPSTGTAPPATVPASQTKAVTSTPSPQTQPGYGAGVGQLEALNPGILSANSPGGPNIPGITGYTVSYNGVPL